MLQPKPLTEPLTVRSAPPAAFQADPQAALSQRQMTGREMSLRAESANEAERTVEAVIATEAPTAVYDWRRDQVIEEVLRMDGLEHGHVVLLESHARWSLNYVLGSVRDIRRDGEQAVARLAFVQGDPDVDRHWRRVQQGHQRNVSAGYRVLEYTEIAPGQTATVGGRQYTAGQRTMRVSTRWQLREVSLVVFGADERATIRDGQDAAAVPQPLGNPMPVTLRAYLMSLGLRAEASDEEAWGFVRQLPDDQRRHADAICTQAGVSIPAAPGTPPPATPPAGQRDAGPALPPPTPAPVDPERIRQEAAAAERNRISAIRALAGPEIEQDLVQRAIDQGWSEEGAAREFLRAMRERRGAGAGAGGGPAIHSRSHEGDCNLQSLQGALLLRTGGQLDHASYQRMEAITLELPTWLRSGLNSDQRQRAMEQAHRYRDMSLVDFCREACRLDGRPAPHSREEAIRAAVSGSALTAIFTTNVNARMLATYAEHPDTTREWTSEADVNDFRTNERMRLAKAAGLEKLARGKTADHTNRSDSKEEYKIARYARQFVVDEQDVIDDSFQALREVPVEMGRSAGRLRPDLVYSILLANDALGATNRDLFNSTDGNLDTGAALAAATLRAAVAAMMLFQENGVNLNLAATHLLVPPSLKHLAYELTNSSQILIAGTAGSVTERGSLNALLADGLRPVSDARLENGVTDPDSGTTHSGSATTWYLASTMGHTIEVGYRAGTGRAPMSRPFVLTQGQWGIGWDVKMDIGAKALDWRALHKATA